MDRRTFLTLSGIGAAGLLLPNTRLIAAEQLLAPVDAARNRRLSDAALTTAKAAGASYCDVRVGRYLRQFVITREAQVENVVNAESSGVGVRVLADGAWGFAATNTLTSDGVATATRQ
ncbi:PmbA/TldA family metallopeptidase, partial [Xanthomonas phaseoli]